MNHTLFLTTTDSLTPDQKRMVNEAFPLLAKEMEKLKRENFALENKVNTVMQENHKLKQSAENFSKAAQTQSEMVRILNQELADRSEIISRYQIVIHGLKQTLKDL